MELVREATGHAFHLRGEEGAIDFANLFDDTWTTEDLAALYLMADEYRKAAAVVHRAVGEHLLPLLEKGVTVGDTLVWRGEKTTERCVDPPGFWHWLSVQDDPNLVEKVFNPDYARKGAIPPAARTTFFEKEKSGKVEVNAVPVQVLEDAKRRRELHGA